MSARAFFPPKRPLRLITLISPDLMVLSMLMFLMVGLMFFMFELMVLMMR